ncbi:MAG: GNAT family N-acetyltransferase [Lentimicrobium sp.]|jgi:GNAT superfamily N-acetyltransferase|nr:GNAT family N-acetyltransferase [Lentimicrobium sp.]MDD2527263.1 GNAT family N-acetyltransferase [Lentimicrobiaceae bacterium]MDD4596557.1 GNAT family N-acetyltransferase [Lentimicrobiaceae bacterium]MDY0024852.1 GNAT family N-acetyltransferase [Lentimicrobium sp.]
MTEIEAKTWWLHQIKAPDNSAVKLPASCKVMQAIKPTRSFYLFLYTEIGRHFQWYNRLMMPAKELQEILLDPLNEFFVLYINGVPGGFAELDVHSDDQTELVYFGLTPEFTGKGYGKPFLKYVMRHAWKRSISKFWLHTCNLDHPAALAFYTKNGFEIYDEDIVHQPIPDANSDPYKKLPW